jgi:putative ABC transport system permease protein
MIFPGQVTQGGARIAAGVSSLTEDDARAIKTECPSVAYASAGARTAGQVVAGEMNWGTEIFGADVDWPFIRSWNVSRGTFFSEAEVKASAKVAVLGATVQRNLFPDSDPIGAVIRIKNVPFRVLGVLERKGGSTMGNDQDDQIVVPYTTVMKRISGSNRLNIVQVAAKGPDAIQPAIQEITALLRQRHRLGPGQDDDFTIRSQEEFAATAAATTQTMRYLLVGIAIVSLVVRRHRDHEHHARVGDRADARDRHPHGDRRQGAPRARAVPAGGDHALDCRRRASASCSASAARGPSRSSPAGRSRSIPARS